MAVTENLYVGDGVTDIYALSFPYLEEDEVKVTLDDVGTTAFTFLTASSIQFTSPPGGGVDIRIYRDTDVDSKKATFAPGTSIRAVDLNENFDQTLYYSQETRALVVNAALGDIPDGSLGTAKIADGAVTTAKLADDAVTAAKIADDAVVTAGIQDSAVTDAKIAADAVTTTKILDDAVTNDKIADSAVNTAQLASSAVSTDKIADDAVTADKLDVGPLAGFRNAIINGNFEIWQRGTSFSSGDYTADRWRTDLDGSGATYAVNQQNVTVGGIDEVPEDARYFLRYNQTVAPTGQTFNLLSQRIEDVRTFAGQEVTLSFYARLNSGTTLAGVRIQQRFGSGGSSTVQTVLATNPSISSTFTRYSYTFTMPSISGKTLGSDSSVQVIFAMALNATFQLDLWGVQLEPGPVATPFERRPIGTELALCQRYYQTYNVGFTTYQNGGSGFNYKLPLRVKMRTTPTRTNSSVTYTNAFGISNAVTSSELTVGAGASATGVCIVTADVALDAEL